MISIAALFHREQGDLQGKPYILHIMRVMNRVIARYPDDYELQQIAVGHDLIEDTEIKVENLIQWGFSERVVAGIWALTKENGKTYVEYTEKVLANLDACKVKMCDLEDNTDISRMRGTDKQDIERLEKYFKFYAKLNAIVG